MIILENGMIQFEFSQRLSLRNPVHIYSNTVQLRMKDYYPLYMSDTNTKFSLDGDFIKELNTIYTLYYKGTEHDPALMHGEASA
jgi:hypothetical protein